MEIQEGHWYENGGHQKGEALPTGDPSYPWLISDLHYTDQGKFYKDGSPSSWDITREVPAPDAETKAEAPETATLRDQFAMVALQSLLCTARDMTPVFKLDGPQALSVWAQMSYVLADAMMEARKGKAKS